VTGALAPPPRFKPVGSCCFFARGCPTFAQSRSLGAAFCLCSRALRARRDRPRSSVMGAPSGLSVDRLDSSVLPVWHIAPSAVLSASTARRYVAAYGLPNLVAQFDQLAALLIQMSGVRLEQRKQDLIGHGEVMLNAIHLAPARISYEIRETTFIKRTIASRFNRCWETAEWKTDCVALA
jgi:hypothetical protein